MQAYAEALAEGVRAHGGILKGKDMEHLSRHQTLFRHFRRRLWERYGIHDAEAASRSIARQILSDKIEPVHKEENKAPLYVVRIEGQSVLIAFSRQRKVAVTALPKESWEYREFAREPALT